VVLTPQGQRLFDAVAEPIDAIEHALRRLGARTGNALTLSLIPSMGTAWLVPRLPGFLSRHPELGLSLQSSTHVVDFEREPVDAALRLGGGQWPGVTAELLFDEWITPVASPDFIARHGKPSLAGISTLPLLGDPGDRWRDWFAAFGGNAPARYVAVFDDTETLHQAAAQGLGIALARQTLAQPLIDSGRLVPLTRKRLKAEFAHYLVYPERSLQHPGFQTLRGWLLEQAGIKAI
jgi:LysR family glycine cleavage system transcriptional activator